MYVCVHVDMRACVRACMHVCVRACMCVCVCACVRACVCVCVCVLAYLHVCMHLCVCLPVVPRVTYNQSGVCFHHRSEISFGSVAQDSFRTSPTSASGWLLMVTTVMQILVM